MASLFFAHPPAPGPGPGPGYSQDPPRRRGDFLGVGGGLPVAKTVLQLPLTLGAPQHRSLMIRREAGTNNIPFANEETARKTDYTMCCG